MIKRIGRFALSAVLALGLCPAMALADVVPQDQDLTEQDQAQVVEQEEPEADAGAAKGDALDLQSTYTYSIKCVEAGTGKVLKTITGQESSTPDVSVTAPNLSSEGYVVDGSDTVTQDVSANDVVEFTYKSDGTVALNVEFYQVVENDYTNLKALETPSGFTAPRAEPGEQVSITDIPRISGYARDGWETSAKRYDWDAAEAANWVISDVDVSSTVKIYYRVKVGTMTIHHYLYKDGMTTTKVAADTTKAIYDSWDYVFKGLSISGYKCVTEDQKVFTSPTCAKELSFYYEKKATGKAKISYSTKAWIYYNHKIYKSASSMDNACANTKLNDRLAQECNGRLAGFSIKNSSTNIEGKIQYRTYLRGKGWTSWTSGGAVAGKNSNSGSVKSGESIAVKLTGDLAEKYDVYYRVKFFGVGWSGWAKNGAKCGSTVNPDLHLRGLQVKIVKKGAGAPGTTKYTFVSESNKDDFAKAVLYNKIQSKSSSTKYISTICTELGRTAFYKGSKGNWKLIKYWKCTTGQNGHLTPHGGFSVGRKGLHFGESHVHRGYHYTAWYWTQIKGGVLYHSVLYHAYSKTRQLPGGRGYGLGKRESGGCVRLELANAYWVYNTVPRGSAIWVF